MDEKGKVWQLDAFWEATLQEDASCWKQLDELFQQDEAPDKKTQVEQILARRSTCLGAFIALAIRLVGRAALAKYRKYLGEEEVVLRRFIERKGFSSEKLVPIDSLAVEVFPMQPAWTKRPQRSRLLGWMDLPSLKNETSAVAQRVERLREALSEPPSDQGEDI